MTPEETKKQAIINIATAEDSWVVVSIHNGDESRMNGNLSDKDALHFIKHILSEHPNVKPKLKKVLSYE